MADFTRENSFSKGSAASQTSAFQAFRYPQSWTEVHKSARLVTILTRSIKKFSRFSKNQINAGDEGVKENKDYLVAAERRWIQWRDAEAYASGGAAGMSAWRED